MTSLGTYKDKFYAEWVEKLPSLEEKVVAITGTTSGTGYWAAVFAIRKNAKVLILLNRKSSRAKEALEKLEAEKKTSGSTTDIIQIACDLMSFESVKQAAVEVNELCSNHGGLNVLANNAGISGFKDERTKDGFEVQMQTNHLSHFLLTKLLLPSFQLALDNEKEVRVCQHSSGARDGGGLKAKYLEKSEPGKLGGNGTYAKFYRYIQTKLANTCFAMMLHKKLQEQGYDVTKFKSVVAEPGASSTNLIDNTMTTGQGSKSFSARMVTSLLICVMRNFLRAQSAADGALPMIHACFADDVDSGDFFYPEKRTVGRPFKAISKGKLSEGNRKKETYSLNEKFHQILWEKSEEACGPFFS